MLQHHSRHLNTKYVPIFKDCIYLIGEDSCYFFLCGLNKTPTKTKQKQPKQTTCISKEGYFVSGITHLQIHRRWLFRVRGGVALNLFSQLVFF